MATSHVARGLRALGRGFTNLTRRRPLAVSFEVTHSCNANCAHCDKGGMIAQEKLATPAEYAAICRRLHPVVAQVSGGEPLLRSDILQIVEEMRALGSLPLLVFVSNAHLLTLEKYRALRAAGVDQFCFSVDFPSDRHDENRHIPGLFSHLQSLVPRLVAEGHNDIAILTVLRRESISYLPKVTALAEEWGVQLNLSAYNPLRTGDKDLLVPQEGLREFQEAIEHLAAFRERTGQLVPTQRVLSRFHRYFEQGGMGGCKAGVRHLVVNPDGRITPCAMFYQNTYQTQGELIQDFSSDNQCDQCYISMRANSEKPLREILLDGLALYRKLGFR